MPQKMGPGQWGSAEEWSDTEPVEECSTHVEFGCGMVPAITLLAKIIL